MREAFKLSFAIQKLLTFFSTNNIGVFEILKFEILMKRYLTMSLVLNNQALTLIL